MTKHKAAIALGLENLREIGEELEEIAKMLTDDFALLREHAGWCLPVAMAMDDARTGVVNAVVKLREIRRHYRSEM